MDRERILGNLRKEDEKQYYQRAAEQFLQRAVIESIKAGYRVNKSEGVALLQDATTTAISLPSGREMEVAVDERGICFARIEGGMYYPVYTERSEKLLEWRKDAQKKANSIVRRYLSSPFFRLNVVLDEISEVAYQIDDSILQLELMLDKFNTKDNVAEDVNPTFLLLSDELQAPADYPTV